MTARSVPVLVRDNDTAAVRVSRVELSVQEGDPIGNSYTVELATAPTDVVTLTLRTIPADAELTVTPNRLTFTPTNWAVPQPVQVTAGHDDDAVDDDVTLQFDAAGGGYDGVPVDVVHVTVQEDDIVTVAEKELVEETLKTVAAGAVSNVATNIGARFSAARGGGTVLTLAGQPVAGDRGLSVLEGIDQYQRWNSVGLEGQSRGMSVEELLRTSAFEVTLGASEQGTGGLGLSHLTLWGRGDAVFFDAGSGDIDAYDGDLLAGYLGGRRVVG